MAKIGLKERLRKRLGVALARYERTQDGRQYAKDQADAIGEYVNARIERIRDDGPVEDFSWVDW